MAINGKLPAPAALYKGKRPQYPLARELGATRTGV
jgi:hypothetical protein